MMDRYVSPAERRRLLSAFLVVATLILLAAFFAFLIVPGTRAVNRPHAGPPVDPPQGVTGWLDPAEMLPAKGYTIPPVDPATVMSPHPPLLASGKALFAKQCASCHGEGGRGDGPAGGTLTPRPRNLTSPDGWKHGPTLAALYRTLEEGLPGTSMAAYTFLPKKDRMALAHHVRSLASFSLPPDDPRALEALARRFATSGEVVPNRIPVSKAVGLLVTEHVPPPALKVMPGSFLEASLARPSQAAALLAGLQGWQASEQVLARGVVASVGANGFAPGVATYTSAQWKRLHQALLEATSPTNDLAPSRTERAPTDAAKAVFP